MDALKSDPVNLLYILPSAMGNGAFPGRLKCNRVSIFRGAPKMQAMHDLTSFCSFLAHEIKSPSVACVPHHLSPLPAMPYSLDLVSKSR